MILFTSQKDENLADLITTSIMLFNGRCQALSRQTSEWKQGPFRPENLDSYCSGQREVSCSLHRPITKQTNGLNLILIICLGHLPPSQPGTLIQSRARSGEMPVPSNRGQWCTHTCKPLLCCPYQKGVYILAALRLF